MNPWKMKLANCMKELKNAIRPPRRKLLPNGKYTLDQNLLSVTNEPESITNYFDNVEDGIVVMIGKARHLSVSMPSFALVGQAIQIEKNHYLTTNKNLMQ